MGPSAEYHISAEYPISVSTAGMTVVRVTLSVDRMAVRTLSPYPNEEWQPRNGLRGNWGTASMWSWLPLGPGSITGCFIAEECLHFPVSSAKSSTSPQKSFMGHLTETRVRVALPEKTPQMQEVSLPWYTVSILTPFCSHNLKHGELLLLWSESFRD